MRSKKDVHFDEDADEKAKHVRARCRVAGAEYDVFSYSRLR